MHVRITWGRLKPGRWDDYEATYRRVLLERGDPVDGLRGRLLVRDIADPDSGGTLSLWDSAEAAHSYEDGELRREVLSQMQEFFSGEFVAHVCEVRAADGELGAR